MAGRRLAFWRSDHGALTVEFVVVFLGFAAVFFFVIEVITYMFFMQTLEKAAQMGVRAAVVSNPVVNAPGAETPIPFRNSRESINVTFGEHCSVASTCINFGAHECGRGAAACADAAGFNRIFAHMNSIAGQLQPENVSIRYEYIGLGFAGGPVAPLVTVTVEGVPYNTGIFGLLLGNVGVLQTLPVRTATMTGEDLQS